MVATARLLLVARTGPLANSLSMLLATIPGVEIVGRVDDLPSALVTMVGEPGPDAVFLDSGPLAEQTMATVTQLAATLPNSRRIVLVDDVKQQQAAESAGADAVLLKGCRPGDLVATIRGLLAAKPAVQPGVRRLTT